MPIVAHNQLPVFDKLRQLGVRILDSGEALHQDIRELHIGLLNMMPDAALKATELQFFRLVGESNPIAQFFVHPFTLEGLERGPQAREHVDNYYESFAQIREQGLDALIITGANVSGPDLSNQPFWGPLIEVVEWAWDNVTSTLCSCLATHAVLEFGYGQKRIPRKSKKWGVFEHQLTSLKHPLIVDVNTHFDVPHSRWNAIQPWQFEAAGLRILATERGGGDVHLATSRDGIRQVLFQGHPEYDTVSLLKEFKRDVMLYLDGHLDAFPPIPENYFGAFERAVINEYRYRLALARKEGGPLPEFPEDKLSGTLDNDWGDTAEAMVGNWMGLIYQLTHNDRNKPFMDHVDPDNPLGL